MSERERWIVYPLLFLALGVALRDELFDLTQSRGVVCERLYVVDEGSGPSDLLEIGRMGPLDSRPVAAGGQLTVDVVRAGTVIADKYSYGGVRRTPPLLDLLRSLGLGRSSGSSNAGKSAQGATPDADVAPPPTPPTPVPDDESPPD